jgi:hypothetical protein
MTSTGLDTQGPSSSILTRTLSIRVESLSTNYRGCTRKNGSTFISSLKVKCFDLPRKQRYLHEDIVSHMILNLKFEKRRLPKFSIQQILKYLIPTTTPNESVGMDISSFFDLHGFQKILVIGSLK